MLEKKASENPRDISAIDTLAKQWDALQQSAVSAHYFETVAEQKNDERSWLNAAYRNFDAFKMA